MTYDEWRCKINKSSVGHVVSHHDTALAWDAAVDETIRVMLLCAETEETVGGLVLMLLEELPLIKTNTDGDS